MEEKTTTLRNSPAPMLGWLIAPLAVMLAIAAIMVAGIDFDLDLNNTAPLLIVAFGAILGITPRVLKENGAVNFSSSALSLATLGAAMVGHQAIVHVSDYGAFTALQFLVVAFGVFFFDSREDTNLHHSYFWYDWNQCRYDCCRLIQLRTRYHLHYA